MMREAWIDKEDAIPVVQQCRLAGDQKSKPVDARDLQLGRLIDEAFTQHPFYGSRKMVVLLRKAGHKVNRKRVQRLMRSIGLAAIMPGPNASRPCPEHKVYPYLLRGVPINQAKSSLEYGHHLHSVGAWFCLLGCDHRLVLASCAELANQQQHGSVVLRGLS